MLSAHLWVRASPPLPRIFLLSVAALKLTAAQACEKSNFSNILDTGTFVPSVCCPKCMLSQVYAGTYCVVIRDRLLVGFLLRLSLSHSHFMRTCADEFRMNFAGIGAEICSDDNFLLLHCRHKRAARCIAILITERWGNANSWKFTSTILHCPVPTKGVPGRG